MTDKKPINLALQGGGAHGAFTWGVIDRLLEDGRVHFEGISGTSAGAMNAAVVADGLVAGGPDGARRALHDFWTAVAREGQKSPIQRNPVNVLLGDWSLDNSPGYMAMDLVSRLFSPYELNPLNLNPLRDLLEDHVDFERVRHCKETKLFISATNVHTGRVRVFDTPEVTCDTVMASACLPFLFRAVEIDGVPYWDGGYMGNPSLFPFFNACSTSDVLLIQINPMTREATPATATEITNRLNEITFNASLQKELYHWAFVSWLIEEGKLDPADYKQILLHRIHAVEEMRKLAASSKMNAEWAFLEHLRDLGRDSAAQWLETSYPGVGHHSTVDIRELCA